MHGVILNDHDYCIKFFSNDQIDHIPLDHNYIKQVGKTIKNQYTKSLPDGTSVSNCNKDQIGTCNVLIPPKDVANVMNKSLVSLENYKGKCTVTVVENATYKLFDVPGDGNCFFSCLSLALQGTTRNGAFYRTLVCGYILENWEAWCDVVSLYHDNGSNQARLYQRRMMERNGWATTAEIKASCDILNINLTIFVRGVVFSGNPLRFMTRYYQESYFARNSNETIKLQLANSHFSLMYPIHVNHIIGQNPDLQFNSTHYHANNSVGSSQMSKNKKIKLNNDRKSKKNENQRKANRKETTSCLPSHLPTEYDVIKQVDVAEMGTYQKCRKLGISYETKNSSDSAKERKNKMQRNRHHIQSAEKKLGLKADDLPSAPPLSEDPHFNNVMDSLRAFELRNASFKFNHCIICHERRLEMKMASENICLRCNSEKMKMKMFSEDNKMYPMPVPKELQNLTLIEQQLICRIAPLIHVHMLKHGGIAANGHCVTFPQNVNEPSKILPKLPSEIQIIKVRRNGSNDTSKEFKVRRSVVQNALTWLKENNPAFSDITISTERLQQLPEDSLIHTDEIVTKDSLKSQAENDTGPAPLQIDPGQVDGISESSVQLPDQPVNIKEQVQQILEEVVGPEHGPVTFKNNTVCIPWPTQNDEPMSEFTTQFFFTLAFPCLFPYALGDYNINRQRTCSSMADWVEHLMWFEDARFAQHQYFKFIVHNIIMRKRTLEQSTYIVKQQLGEEQLSLSEIKEKIQNGDNSIAKKILYFGASLRGTSQYWAQRRRELHSLMQYNINEGKGLPSLFATGSCAEYYFKSLKNLLEQYILLSTGHQPDLSDKNVLFTVLQKNTHIVSHYFDLRTKAYFDLVMGPAFKVDAYWYRMEFAKSRGMIHWHGLCWRSDREPHNLIHQAVEQGLSHENVALRLSDWAKQSYGLTALHPAGKDTNGFPIKDKWPPPEGNAEMPADEDNPLLKLLMDVSESQEKLLDDYLQLTNKINIHRCSGYCLRKKGKDRLCRMEFGSEKDPGKPVRDQPEIVRDKNNSMRLEMERDHPLMVQHSRFHTQGWRANGDMSLILSKSPPENPSVDEIIATEKYVSGYACKGNESTGAMVDLYNDIVDNANDNYENPTKSICTKLLMGTVKRDISSMESSYELLSLPLYRCSHQFQSVSFSGSRVLEKTGKTFTRSTPLDKYLARPIEDTCSWYTHICSQGKVPVMNGSSVRATWPLNEEYCRSMLLLHWPSWRNIEDIKKSDQSWLQIMNNFMTTDECPNFVKADIERAKRHISDESNQNSQSGDDEENDLSEDRPEWMQILEPHQTYSTDEYEFYDGGPDHDWSFTNGVYPSDLGKSWLDNIDKSKPAEMSGISDESLNLLNVEQKFAFSLILNTLLNYRNDRGFEPLRLVVSGTAGSGKSFLIKSAVHAIRKLFGRSDTVQVLCPTGNSANLISGKTIHDFLKIPSNKQVSKEMIPPDGAKGQTIQDNCKNLLALFIDERSLVGCNTLGWMEFHCRFGMGKSEAWGGLPVVVFLGDDVQLPPVCDTPVYKSSSSSPAAMHGSLIWKSFRHVVQLQTIIRQESDQEKLKNILLSLREYKSTHKDTEWLQKYQWNNLKLSHGEELLRDMTDNGLFVFPTHASEHKHNMARLLEQNHKAPVAKVNAVNHGIHAKQATSDSAGGLLHTLHLCVGAKVMLTCNLAVQYGLFNGSIGYVRDIIYLNGRSPEDGLPDVVMALFPQYTGPPFLQSNPLTLPIVPVERRIDCFCKSCSRKQLPLRLGWGTTIHRCQGMTIGSGQPNRYIVIDPGSTKFESTNPGALFVALSRAKTAGNDSHPPDFAWNPNILINTDRICHIVQTPTVRAREKEISRLNSLAVTTKQFFKSTDNAEVFNRILREVNPVLISEE